MNIENLIAEDIRSLYEKIMEKYSSSQLHDGAPNYKDGLIMENCIFLPDGKLAYMHDHFLNGRPYVLQFINNEKIYAYLYMAPLEDHFIGCAMFSIFKNEGDVPRVIFDGISFGIVKTIGDGNKYYMSSQDLRDIRDIIMEKCHER